MTGRVRAHSGVRETCVRRHHAAWGVTICRSILPFARGCRVGVWFGFVRAALLPAVGTCVVFAFGAMPGRCCFLRVTHTTCAQPLVHPQVRMYMLHAYMHACMHGYYRFDRYCRMSAKVHAEASVEVSQNVKMNCWQTSMCPIRLHLQRLLRMQQRHRRIRALMHMQPHYQLRWWCYVVRIRICCDDGHPTTRCRYNQTGKHR